MISALQHKSKYKSNSISNFLKKKIKFFGSHVVVLVKTFPLTYQLFTKDWYWRSQGDFFSRQTETRGTDRIQFRQFRTFWKKFHISGFPWSSTREDLSIDVSITNVGLILTKLRWFQLFVKSQNLNFELFWKKKIQFLGWHRVVLVKTFPLMYQLLM